MPWRAAVAALATRATGQRDPRDAGDRGQRFATKAERADTFEILKRADLRGRVAGEGERQFVARDSATVVADADQFDAPFLELDLDRRAARVEGVFEQLLEH
ncbi:MAG: hypothetical protein AW11_03473 [Candidatus Accumulibacter regalis]|uniref:Uncharacterized protein n=1 Tax=Accumulibacter regalis TaxID=522306 RepID=A0A011R2U9_ACCRE|nr:MAG: hypothetical protein AW11_03473 [Candidatus Accumulibacter regalis]